MKRLSLLLVSFVVSINAHAVDWTEVTKSRSGSIFSLDLDSIERSDISIIDEKNVQNITVSMLRTYPAQKGKAKEKTIHHSDQQLLIACKDASYYKRAYVNYDVDDKVIKSWQSEKPILTTKDFTLTTPKTVGRLLVDKACKSYVQRNKS